MTVDASATRPSDSGKVITQSQQSDQSTLSNAPQRPRYLPIVPSRRLEMGQMCAHCFTYEGYWPVFTYDPAGLKLFWISFYSGQCVCPAATRAFGGVDELFYLQQNPPIEPRHVYQLLQHAVHSREWDWLLFYADSRIGSKHPCQAGPRRPSVRR